jgi:phosphatidylinositol alpha-1,6-mannosyltransferase
LLLTEVFPPQVGGSGRWFWELYRRLPREEFVIAAGACPGDVAFDRTHDLRVVRLPMQLPSWGFVGARPLWDYLSLAARIRRICRERSIGFIHAGCCLPEGFGAWMLKWISGIPYSLFVHGEEMRIMAGSRELSWMARRVLGSATRLIANSHNTAGILCNEWNVPQERIVVLHPGVDTQRFKPAPKNATVRERLGWSERPVVLTVGRLQKRKGHDMLIRALPAIRERIPDILYSIVGDGEERASLERLTDELGVRPCVQFRGEPSDDQLVECYQQCDLFVLPNREVNGDIEGFGMVLIEAQACGKPVIAGASGGTKETMLVKTTGKVVRCDEPHELVATTAQLLEQPCLIRQMGIEARRWAVDSFDWTSLCRRAEMSLAIRQHRCSITTHSATAKVMP